MRISDGVQTCALPILFEPDTRLDRQLPPDTEAPGGVQRAAEGNAAGTRGDARGEAARRRLRSERLQHRPPDLPLADLRGPLEGLRVLPAADGGPLEIGRAHVRTPVTIAHLACRLLLDKKTHHTKNLHTPF